MINLRPNETLRLGEVLYEIDDEQGHVQSIWPDGKRLIGAYSYDEEDVARARSLGYTGTDLEVCAALHREHDLAHHLVAQALGWPSSMVLRLAAEGHETFPVGVYQLEERLAFLVQRVSNIGIPAVALSEDTR